MATINEVIARVDRVKLNSYEDAAKAGWLTELDGRIYTEVFRSTGDEPPRDYPADGDRQLLVAAPYDNLYDLYLYAMIDYSNRETANYNNSMTMFDTALDEWRKQYHRTHLPPAAAWRGLL